MALMAFVTHFESFVFGTHFKAKKGSPRPKNASIFTRLLTAESFIHTFKSESFYQRKFENLQQIKKEFMSYIYFYNNERLHSSLDYVSPNEIEQRAA